MEDLESLPPIDLSEISDPVEEINRILGIFMGILLMLGDARVGGIAYGVGEIYFSWQSNILQFSDSPLVPRPEPYRSILSVLDIVLGIMLIIGELSPNSLFHLRGRTSISFSGPPLQVSEQLENNPAAPVIIRAISIFLGIFMLIPGRLFLTGFAPLRPGRTSLAVTGPPLKLSSSPGTVPGEEPARTVGVILRIIVAWLLIIDVFTVSGLAISPEMMSFSVRSPIFAITP